MRSEQPLRTVFLSLVFAMLVVGGALPASSAETCGPGADLSAPMESGDESGLGGTGIGGERHIARGEDSESGIGGTGILGIFGTVTRLDDLCVNGLEIHVPDQLSILAPNGEASDHSLALGMVVWALARPTDDGLVANQIQVYPDLAGQIETISHDGRELVVSGHRVRVPSDVWRGPALQDEEPRAGQWIVVHGLRDASGQLIASRIESGRERETRSIPGALATWLGTWLRESAGPRTVSMEGYITGSREAPQLAGLNLRFQPGHPRAPEERLEPGVRIRVEGRITPEHVLLIERPFIIQPPRRIEPEERPTPSSRVAPNAAPPRPQTRPPSSKRGERPRPTRPTKPTTIDRPPHRPSAPPRPERPAAGPSRNRPTPSDSRRP